MASGSLPEAMRRIEELPYSREALFEIGIDNGRSGIWWFVTRNETLMYFYNGESRLYVLLW